jgi:hypothetical protein
MPTTFTVPDSGTEVWQIAKRLIANEESFRHLRDVELTYEILFAWNDEGQPLKHHGYPALAVIKINSYQDRVEGKADCTVKIDGKEWGEWNPTKREAVLHHEFLHLEVVMDKSKDKKTGEVTVHGPKSDDIGRPKLKIRLHDFEVGIFKETAEKYRGDSGDVQQIEPLVQWVQTTLNFG